MLFQDTSSVTKNNKSIYEHRDTFIKYFDILWLDQHSKPLMTFYSTDAFNPGCLFSMPIGSMGRTIYLPTFTIKINEIHVGKSTKLVPKGPSWDTCKNIPMWTADVRSGGPQLSQPVSPQPGYFEQHHPYMYCLPGSRPAKGNEKWALKKNTGMEMKV